MTDEDKFPGVYVDETETARQTDGVPTSGGVEQPDEGSSGSSIPGVPTASQPESPGAQPVERVLSDDRAGAPVHVSDETAG